MNYKKTLHYCNNNNIKIIILERTKDISTPLVINKIINSVTDTLYNCNKINYK